MIRQTRRASIDKPLLYAGRVRAVNDGYALRGGRGWTRARLYDGRLVARAKSLRQKGSESRVRGRRRKIFRVALVLVAILAALLLIPEPAPDTPVPADAEPFVWDQDALWEALEARFIDARRAGCVRAEAPITSHLSALSADVLWLEGGGYGPSDPRLDAILEHVFSAAPLVAACPARSEELVQRVVRLRAALKRTSREWDVSEAVARRRIYRLLYGSRTAIEEVMLQMDRSALSPVVMGTPEPSRTPAAELLGIEVHSGDILVSRGGAPTSALIARGNDYPGNFSHIALLHVGEDGEARVIEAHIEVGVTVSSLETYLADEKLRVMVLRLAHDLDAMVDDPMLPHRAAEAALAEARARHVPYDFAMRYDEHSAMFCSEVASAPYADLGVDLWEGLTSMSSRGVTSWLSRFGVEQFVTHGPSDLEYDPKVVVVAEWRDPDALFDDHVDNAVIDAMLEGAERGDQLDYDYRMLPLARLAKSYSVLLNLFGDAGPVPEGMSATRALRAEWLSARHAKVKEGVLRRAETFRQQQGYTPPYWDLVDMARESLGTLD